MNIINMHLMSSDFLQLMPLQNSIFITAEFKGELHSNYIFLYFVLIDLEWDSINLFTKMNVFFFPKLTFQHHLHKTYI